MDWRRLGTILLAALATIGPLAACRPVVAQGKTRGESRLAKPASHGAAWSWLKSKAQQAFARSDADRPPAPLAEAKQTPPASSQQSMAHFQWTFADVEAKTVVDRLESYGVKLPVEIEGQLTVELNVGVPWRSPLESEEYDLEGELQSARMTVAGIEVRNVSARVKHDQGWLTLENLQFDVPDSADPKRSGTVTGDAEMQLSPPGELTARLALERVPLAEVRSLLSDLAIDLSGQASGRADARVAVERLHDRTAWRVRGKLATHEMSVLGLPPASLRADVDLEGGVLRADKLEGEAEHTKLAGAGRLHVVAPFDYSAALNLTTGKLSHLNGLRPELKLPIEIRGAFGASVRLSGSLAHNRHVVAGTVTAPQVLLEGVTLEQLKFSFDADQDRVHIHPLNAGVYGGRIDLSLAMPLAPGEEVKAGLRWHRLPVDRLARDAAGIEGTPAGASSGVLQLRLPAGKWTELSAWHAHGKVDLHQPNAPVSAGSPSGNLPRATANLRLTAGRLQVSDIAVTAGASQLTGSVELQIAAPHNYRLSLNAADVDLELIEPLARAWRPSVRLRGRVNATTDLQGTLSPLLMHGQGSVAAKDVRLGPARAESLRWQFVADKHGLELRQVQAELYGGRLEGALAVGLSERGSTQAALDWRQLNLNKLCEDLALAPLGAAGTASGSFRGASPPGDLLDPARWQGEAAATIRGFALAGMPTTHVEIEARAARGVLTVSKLSASQAARQGEKGAVLSASGAVKLAAPFAFRAALNLDEFDLAGLDSLPAGVRPPLEVQGKLSTNCEAQGALAPLNASARGAARAENLRLNHAAIDALEFDFQLDPDFLSLESIRASLDGGQANGAVKLPLAEDEAGRLALTLKQIDLARLLAGLVKLPLHVDGRADAQVDVQIPPGQLKNLGEWVVQASLDASKIVADAMPLGHIRARLTSEREVLHYQIGGEALEGQLDVQGEWRLPDAKHAEGINAGRMKLTKLQLHRASELLRQHGKLAALEGEVSVEFDYRHDEATGRPLGAGRLEVDGVRWNDEQLADRVRGSISLLGDRVEIEELTGELAEGELLVHGVTYLAHDQRSMVDVELYGADFKRMLFAWPSLAEHSHGMADLDLRLYHGRGQPWQMHGDLQLHEGEIGEVVVHNLRTPVEISFDPANWRRELRLQGLVIEMSPGRISGDVHLVAEDQLDLDVKGQVANVHLQKAFRHSPHNPKGSGAVSGAFHLSGRNVRSFHDLHGRIQAKLRDAHGLPVLHHARTHTSGGLNAASRFSEGDVLATLSRGVLHIERLTLSGQKTQVYATGQASVGGKLGLEVTVKTNALSPAAQGVASAATELALLAAPPLALVLEANQLLTNQVIHLQVRGTMRSPSIRIRPLPLLGEEAIRFFLAAAPPP